MLRNLNSIQGYRVVASGEHLGDLADVYFDDGRWRVRYFVADTTDRSTRQGLWFSPAMAAGPDDEASELPVSFTRAQLDEIAVSDPDQSDSDPEQSRLHDEYGWPHYWLAPILGRGAGPVAFTDPEGPTPAGPTRTNADPHLRSVSEIQGYAISGTDGTVGRVSGFVCDDDDWEIRYLVGSDGSSSRGNLFIAPSRVQRVDWDRSVVEVDLTVGAIRESSQEVPDHVG